MKKLTRKQRYGLFAATAAAITVAALWPDKKDCSVELPTRVNERDSIFSRFDTCSNMVTIEAYPLKKEDLVSQGAGHAVIPLAELDSTWQHTVDSVMTERRKPKP